MSRLSLDPQAEPHYPAKARPGAKLTEPMRELLARISDDWQEWPRYYDVGVMKALRRRDLVETSGPGGTIRKSPSGRAVFAK